MNFVETEEQQALRQAVAAMATNYGQDYYLEKARSGQHTTELWSEAGKLGFIGVNLPEEYGGGGAGMARNVSRALTLPEPSQMPISGASRYNRGIPDSST